MKETAEGVSVNILGKEFIVACPPEERESLLAAAAYLDRKLREIQTNGKVLGTERAAIIAALNISHELLEQRRHGDISESVTQRLRFLQSKIDAALHWDAALHQ
ncbi:MAG: cell division protein ZapA [Gammaproteobacteria bacterium]|nr:cell division protein ZapA [Gammaproteobacteria bacterium]